MPFPKRPAVIRLSGAELLHSLEESHSSFWNVLDMTPNDGWNTVEYTGRGTTSADFDLFAYHPEMRSEENSQLTISILRLLSFRLVPNPIAYSMGFNEEYLAPGEYCHGSNSSGMLSTSL